jgi:hypothetical protein
VLGPHGEIAPQPRHIGWHSNDAFHLPPERLGEMGANANVFGDAIGVPLPVTVLRNGAMVDVIAVPTELG